MLTDVNSACSSSSSRSRSSSSSTSLTPAASLLTIGDSTGVAPAASRLRRTERSDTYCVQAKAAGAVRLKTAKHDADVRIDDRIVVARDQVSIRSKAANGRRRRMREDDDDDTTDWVTDWRQIVRNWLKDAPTYEDVHPRRSWRREPLCEIDSGGGVGRKDRFSWLHLEDMIMRMIVRSSIRAKTTNGSSSVRVAQTSAELLWITHAAHPVGFENFTLKSMRIRPILIPSTFILHQVQLRESALSRLVRVQKTKEDDKVVQRQQNGCNEVERPVLPLVRLTENHLALSPNETPSATPYETPCESPRSNDSFQSLDDQDNDEAEESDAKIDAILLAEGERCAKIEGYRWLIRDELQRIQAPDWKQEFDIAWMMQIDSVSSEEKQSIRHFLDSLSTSHFDYKHYEQEQPPGLSSGEMAEIEEELILQEGTDRTDDELVNSLRAMRMRRGQQQQHQQQQRHHEDIHGAGRKNKHGKKIKYSNGFSSLAGTGMVQPVSSLPTPKDSEAVNAVDRSSKNDEAVNAVLRERVADVQSYLSHVVLQQQQQQQQQQQMLHWGTGMMPEQAEEYAMLHDLHRRHQEALDSRVHAHMLQCTADETLQFTDPFALSPGVNGSMEDRYAYVYANAAMEAASTSVRPSQEYHQHSSPQLRYAEANSDILEQQMHASKRPINALLHEQAVLRAYAHRALQHPAGPWEEESSTDAALAAMMTMSVHPAYQQLSVALSHQQQRQQQQQQQQQRQYAHFQRGQASKGRRDTKVGDGVSLGGTFGHKGKYARQEKGNVGASVSTDRSSRTAPPPPPPPSAPRALRSMTTNRASTTTYPSMAAHKAVLNVAPVQSNDAKASHSLQTQAVKRNKRNQRFARS